MHSWQPRCSSPQAESANERRSPQQYDKSSSSKVRSNLLVVLIPKRQPLSERAAIKTSTSRRGAMGVSRGVLLHFQVRALLSLKIRWTLRFLQHIKKVKCKYCMYCSFTFHLLCSKMCPRPSKPAPATLRPPSPHQAVRMAKSWKSTGQRTLSAAPLPESSFGVSTGALASSEPPSTLLSSSETTPSS